MPALRPFAHAHARPRSRPLLFVFTLPLSLSAPYQPFPTHPNPSPKLSAAAPLFDLLTLDPDGNETTPSNCDESRPCCETSEVSLAARPAAEPELAQTASTADREAAARGEETFEHTQYKSRREAFDLAFDRVDSDENGYVSVSEIRVLATLDSPAANAAEVRATSCLCT